MAEVNIISNSAKRTKEIGAQVAETFLKHYQQKKHAPLFLLKGDLGAGKTTFLQGFAKRIGVKDRILSPTFILMRKFEIQRYNSNKNFFKSFYHIDCYRLKSSKELILLGIKKIFLNPQNIIAIEWPEKIADDLPKISFLVEFRFIDKKSRLIKLSWLKNKKLFNDIH